jgi:hypothetical protein
MVAMVMSKGSPSVYAVGLGVCGWPLGPHLPGSVGDGRAVGIGVGVAEPVARRVQHDGGEEEGSDEQAEEREEVGEVVAHVSSVGEGRAGVNW